MKGLPKRILAVVVKYRHRANGLLSGRTLNIHSPFVLSVDMLIINIFKSRACTDLISHKTLHTNKEKVLLIKSHCTWCIIVHLIGQWAYELLMSFRNTVNVQLYLFIPESRKVLKRRVLWQTSPSPTRPIHFGGHVYQAISEMHWPRRPGKTSHRD